MNSNITLSLAPRASLRPVRVARPGKVVRARALPARRTVPALPALSPSGRAETMLMAASFLALAGLALVMEAAGVAAALVG